MAYTFKKTIKPQNLTPINPRSNLINTGLSQLAVPNDLATLDAPVLGVSPAASETPSVINLGDPLPLQGSTTLYKFNINLKKEVYSCKGARDVLDEEFEEFNILNLNYKKFFDMHDRFFYDLQPETHDYFLAESIKYLGVFTNPRDTEILNLKEEIRLVEEQIDSIEVNHPYIPNGRVIASSTYENNPGSAIEQGNIFYMQSSKRRPIKTPEIYYGLKNRLGTETTSDKSFIIFLDDLTTIGEGPEIIIFDDIYKPPGDVFTEEDSDFARNNIILYVNRYPNV